MSNAVDVLAVTGAANGRQVCIQRDRITGFIDFPLVANGRMTGSVSYPVIKWQHPASGKWYWIAAPNFATNEEIIAEILVANFQPAWDLN